MDPEEKLPSYNTPFWVLWDTFQLKEGRFLGVFMLQSFNKIIATKLEQELKYVGAEDRLQEYRAAHRAAVHVHVQKFRDLRGGYSDPLPIPSTPFR